MSSVWSSQIPQDEDEDDAPLSDTDATQNKDRSTQLPPFHPNTVTKKRKRNSKTLKSTATETKLRSHVWPHFERFTIPVYEENDDGEEVQVGEEKRAICKYCSTEFNGQHGMSVLRKHLMRHCKKYPGKSPRNSSKAEHENPESPSQRKSVIAFSQESCMQATCEMIVLCELPFSFVEQEGFRRFCGLACPLFAPPSRRSIVREFLDMYDAKKVELRNELQRHRVCLTTDTWTSVQNQSYMVLTAHFIDCGWKMHKRVLKFCQISNHKGTTIGKILETCLEEWKIDKVLTVSVDNASANKVAIEWLKKKMNSWDKPASVFDGKFIHVRCLAHILNIIVKSGLNILDKSVEAIRNAVKYVRSSPARLTCFKSCIEKEKLEPKAMCVLDVPTRWNSTYLMLQSTLVLKKAFERLAEEEDNKFASYFNEYEEDEEEEMDEENETKTKNQRKRVGPPTEADWNKATVFVKFLKSFYDVIMRTSASTHPTAQRAFHDIVAIESEIYNLFPKPGMSNNSEEERTLREMAVKMRAKFQKYFNNIEDVNQLLLVALVLDPRFKLRNFEHVCRKRLEFTKEEVKLKSDELRNLLVALTDLYASSSASVSQKKSNNMQTMSGYTMDDEEEASGMIAKMNVDWERELEKTAEVVEQHEVDKYLLEPVLKPPKENHPNEKKKNFNLLNHWRVNADRFPNLAVVARDVLAIQISTVASESCFSTGKRVIDPHRSSLSPKSVEALMCLQNWIRSEDIAILEYIPSSEEMEFYEGIEKDHVEEVLASKPTRPAKSPRISEVIDQLKR